VRRAVCLRQGRHTKAGAGDAETELLSSYVEGNGTVGAGKQLPETWMLRWAAGALRRAVHEPIPVAAQSFSDDGSDPGLGSPVRLSTEPTQANVAMAAGRFGLVCGLKPAAHRA
jgi:hypothetical protein